MDPTILLRSEPIKAGVFVYYRAKNDDTRCVRLKSSQEDNLNKLGWIYHERMKQRWIKAEHMPVDGQVPAEKEIYINLHKDTGVKCPTVVEDQSMHEQFHDQIVASYKDPDRARQLLHEPKGCQHFLSMQEAEQRLERVGKVEYLESADLLNKEPKQEEELGIDLQLVSTELIVQEVEMMDALNFFGEMEVAGVFRKQPEFNRDEFFKQQVRCEDANKDIFEVDRISLKRLMKLVFDVFYFNYLWFIKMTEIDKGSRNCSPEAQVFCWTAAQHCLEVIQNVSNVFKIKMLLKDSELKVIAPESGSIDYTFVLTGKEVPMIYKGDRFPNSKVEVQATIMRDFGVHNQYSNVADIEAMLWEKVHQARRRIGRDEEEFDVVFNNDAKLRASRGLSDVIGNGRRTGRRSEIYNFEDDLPMIRNTPKRNKQLLARDTRIFKIMNILKGGDNAADLAQCIQFDVTGDEVAHSTRLDPRRASVMEHLRDRSRSRERSRSRGRVTPILTRAKSQDDLAVKSGAKPKIQFAPGSGSGESEAIGNANVSAVQSLLNMSNLELTEWPLTTSMHRCDAEFTRDEDEKMGVDNSMDEVEQLTARSQYVKYFAPFDEEHTIVGITELIRDKIEESKIHYDQDVEEMKEWKASRIKDFAKEYKDMQSFVKILRDEGQRLEENMNKSLKDRTISDLGWKLGKFATKAAGAETKRLLELIRANNALMKNRNISKSDKDVKVSQLKEMMGVFTGEDLAHSAGTRTFQQFKTELENNLEHCQVDKKDWGYYTKYLLDGEAKATLEREMPNDPNPDYAKMMEHLKKNHGKASDVLRVIKEKQLLLENITSTTSGKMKQEICKSHRNCFDRIREVLKTTNENVGSVREHLCAVLVKFPDHHRHDIKKLLDNEEGDIQKAITEFHAVCEYIHDMAKVEVSNERFSSMNQSFAAMTPIQPGKFKQGGNQQAPNGPNPKTFVKKNAEVALCKVCNPVKDLGVQPFSNNKEHVWTSSGTPVLDACPNMRELNTENKEKRAILIRLCRVCGKEYISDKHSEGGCSFNVKTIQCKEKNCNFLAAFCNQHRSMNTPIHETKQKRLKAVGVHYNFSCQRALETDFGQAQLPMIRQTLLYTHKTVQDMIKEQDPGRFISEKEGVAIFPMGMMYTPYGGAVPYSYDSGASLTSIMVGSEGISFPTAPVDPDEEDQYNVNCVAGNVAVKLVYILIPLVDGSLAKIKAQVIGHTLQNQTKNLKELAQEMLTDARTSGRMMESEKIQCPAYKARAVLLLGRSHSHLAPRVVHRMQNGLKLYAGCIDGPGKSKGPDGKMRTLCIGGSLLDSVEDARIISSHEAWKDLSNKSEKLSEAMSKYTNKEYLAHNDGTLEKYASEEEDNLKVEKMIFPALAYKSSITNLDDSRLERLEGR